MPEPTPVAKACTTCSTVKPVTSFPVQGRGRAAVCSACRRASAPTEKYCAKCRETKPLGEFPLIGGYYRHPCKKCERARHRHPGSPPRRQFPAPPDGQKWCTKCDECKLVEEFPRRQSGCGRGSWCNGCVAAHNRRQYERPEVRDDRRARWKRWKAENPGWDAEWYGRDLERGREKSRRAANRRRARLLSLPVEPYTMAELVERDGTCCVLCDEALDFTVDHPHPKSPTVEHLECLSWPDSAGDIPSNCAVAHFDCNNRRGDRPHSAAARKRAELLALMT